MSDEKKRLVDSDPGENAEKIDRAFERAARQHVNREWLLLLVLLMLLLGYSVWQWPA